MYNVDFMRILTWVMDQSGVGTEKAFCILGSCDFLMKFSGKKHVFYEMQAFDSWSAKLKRDSISKISFSKAKFQTDYE